MLRIPPPEDDGFALELIKMESERPVGILGKETAQQHLSSAELRDGTRPRVLALKPAKHPCEECCGAAARWELGTRNWELKASLASARSTGAQRPKINQKMCSRGRGALCC